MKPTINRHPTGTGGTKTKRTNGSNHKMPKM